MDEAAMLEALNGIWKNFCISDAFEPGSTVKPMTVAAALQDRLPFSPVRPLCVTGIRCLEIPESVVPFFQAPMESRLWRRLWQIPAMTP